MINSYFFILKRHYKQRMKIFAGIIYSCPLNALPSFIDHVKIDVLDKQTKYKMLLRGGLEVRGDDHTLLAFCAIHWYSSFFCYHFHCPPRIQYS
jgi:hypothetical protein